MADLARESAFNILHHLHRKQLTLDTVMNDFTEGKVKLDKRDLGLVQAIVYGVIRWRLHLDHIIGHFSKTPLEKISPEILNILRMGIYQIKFMSKIPESAAVNTSVELAKKNGPVWVVKFVNGVLSNAARQMDSVPFPDKDSNLTLSIALQYSFPTWLVQRWLNRFGDQQTICLCERLNSIPEISIRTNTLKTDKIGRAHV
jgi:16S rRNA (cytosine967-C5)-methyltransferase